MYGPYSVSLGDINSKLMWIWVCVCVCLPYAICMILLRFVYERERGRAGGEMRLFTLVNSIHWPDKNSKSSYRYIVFNYYERILHILCLPSFCLSFVILNHSKYCIHYSNFPRSTFFFSSSILSILFAVILNAHQIHAIRNRSFYLSNILCQTIYDVD